MKWAIIAILLFLCSCIHSVIADEATLLLAVEPQAIDGNNLTLTPADQAIFDSLSTWGYAVKTVKAKV